MPIPTLITDLSQTAGSNYPAGSDSPSVLDDVQRAHASFIAKLRDEKTDSANLANTTDPSKGAGLVGFSHANTYAQGTVGLSLKREASAKDAPYNATGGGTTDDTAAINNALAAHSTVFVPDGTYRIDGTVTVNANKSLILSSGARLIRLSAYSANTAPVLHLKGNYSRFSGGTIESQNNSPGGVVALGHLDHLTSNWNAVFWRFENCDVFAKDFGGAAASPYPGIFDGVGVYLPSSQPYLGSSYVNYFGTCSNVRVYNATTSWYLNDLANSHTFVNCNIEFFYHRAWLLNGAYGNTSYGGFINGCYTDNKIAIYLGTKNYPAAPHASNLESMWNNFYGSTMELYTVGMVGVEINTNCQANFIQFSWNSTGTAYIDNDSFNTIIESRVAQFTKLATTQIDGVGENQMQQVFIAPKFSDGTVYGIRVSGGAEVIPNIDNAINLGKAAFRYGTVFAGTGTINTSDARTKQQVKPLNDKEKAVALKCKDLIRSFKFNDAVEKKGDAARIHFGVVAQDVVAAFNSEGLKADDYALLCYDEWEKQEEIRNDDGGLVQAARDAGGMYGIRYEELLAFIIGAM